MFQYYSELPEDDLNILRQLKHSIESSSKNTSEYCHSLNEYYDELSEMFQLITDPLPPDCELEESLLPKYYLDFKEEYQRSGPYTFLNDCRSAKLIAFVQVISVKNRGAKVTAKPLSILKGQKDEFESDCFGNIKFNVYTAWSYACFQKGEKALILLEKVSTKTAIIWSSSKKFEVSNRDGIEIVMAKRAIKSYWHDINIDKINENNLVIIPWKQLETWIINNLQSLS
ncbi:MAG: hypothetical protein RM368_34175 [Nostoc sp. DedSLP03]|uniref:hypothetical protein n=1 Tax=Nostoc sp. DedSLP03 TaxID=3075400 RepID=UPI002AD55DFB|nr:hypothetical protein [Nostoc sp. DedSLP03]MDZ7969931.1 hypothetical protein [Nostoc sp. DedSLP03]